jgi:hypothetical protein
MIAELLTAVSVWIAGLGHTDKVALRAALSKGTETGGYSKQIETCVWPHRCVEGNVVLLAQVQTCVWPHTCASMN